MLPNLTHLLKKSKGILYKNKYNKPSIITERITSIIYGINETPFGKVLLAKTDKGICDLLFVNCEEETFIKNFLNRYSKANFIRDNSATQNTTEKIFYSKEDISNFKLHLTGTDFQIRVWKALLNIPKSHVVSYSDISEFIGKPNANRAVGTAIGRNPLLYLIPCHRVIRSDGNLGGFASGIDKKILLLKSENPNLSGTTF